MTSFDLNALCRRSEMPLMYGGSDSSLGDKIEG